MDKKCQVRSSPCFSDVMRSTVPAASLLCFFALKRRSSNLGKHMKRREFVTLLGRGGNVAARCPRAARPDAARRCVIAAGCGRFSINRRGDVPARAPGYWAGLRAETCGSKRAGVRAIRNLFGDTRQNWSRFPAGSSGSWPNMALGRLAKRRCAQFGKPASSTFEPSHANASPSLARPLRTEPCTGTYRLAFYNREHLSSRGDLSNHR
jgi:hypothetical protein